MQKGKELTNAELRLAIANKKYIGVKKSCPYGFPVFPTGEGDDEHYEECPNWLEDIAAAWDLMEEMKIVIIGVTFFEGKWTSSYSNEISYSTFDADTAPRAICLAWLAWKELQK